MPRGTDLRCAVQTLQVIGTGVLLFVRWLVWILIHPLPVLEAKKLHLKRPYTVLYLAKHYGSFRNCLRCPNGEMTYGHFIQHLHLTDEQRRRAWDLP